MIPSAGEGIIPSSTLWNEFRKLFLSATVIRLDFLTFGRRCSVAGLRSFQRLADFIFPRSLKGLRPTKARWKRLPNFNPSGNRRPVTSNCIPCRERFRRSHTCVCFRVGNFELTGLLFKADRSAKQSCCQIRLPPCKGIDQLPIRLLVGHPQRAMKLLPKCPAQEAFSTSIFLLDRLIDYRFSRRTILATPKCDVPARELNRSRLLCRPEDSPANPPLITALRLSR